jgi:hypothetical protein
MAGAAANGKVRRCVEQLAFSEFKKQKLGKLKEDEKRKGGPTMGGSGASPYDNIFKTLMHEITSQEINQSIFDMYVTALQQCLAQALEEIRSEKEKDRLAREDSIRFLSNRVQNLSELNQDLVARVHRLESNFVATTAAWLIALLCVFLLLLSTCMKALRKG